MYTRNSSSGVQWNLDLPAAMGSNGTQSEEYFKRMVEIKDKNIQDLLKQLRETKQIYQQYKAQYLNEEKRMKTKLSQITVKLETQLGEMEKYKQTNIKLKADLQASVEREKKSAQTYEKKIAQLKNSLLQLETRNKELQIEKNIMLEKQATLQQKCIKIEERLKNKTDETRMYEEETRRIRDELLRRNEQWKIEKQMLIEKANEQQRRKIAKDRANTRLDAIENKIKTNLMKI